MNPLRLFSEVWRMGGVAASSGCDVGMQVAVAEPGPHHRAARRREERHRPTFHGSHLGLLEKYRSLAPPRSECGVGAAAVAGGRDGQEVVGAREAFVRRLAPTERHDPHSLVIATAMGLLECRWGALGVDSGWHCMWIPFEKCRTF